MDEKESVQPETKPETHPQKSMRGTLRWVLAVLLAFGLGALCNRPHALLPHPAAARQSQR